MTKETVREDPVRNAGPDEGVRPREKWANKWEFMLSLNGVLFSLGNLVRFPVILAVRGGDFVYAYCFCLFFIGMPMLFLETALGQYTSEGAATAWKKICPMFQGVGIASQVIVTYGNIYLIVMLSWVIFYLVNSFRSSLPWSTCENAWNTESCHSHVSVFANPHLFRPDANWSFLNNLTFSGDYTYTDYGSEMDTHNKTTTPEEEFWIARVLRISGDMNLGEVPWDLALCLLLAWVICYFCTWKGIRITGKVVYVTATIPYVILVILFIRGVILPGSANGILFGFRVTYPGLVDIKLWIDALYEVFYTHALCLGVLTTLGSYNKYNHDCYRDCWILSCLLAVTTILTSLVVYSVLGFLSYELNVPIGEFVHGGLGLLFVNFPRALSLLPGSSFWAVLFFFMLFLLAIDNQCLCMDSLATAIIDLFPRYLRRPLGREMLVLVIAVISFLLGLPFITMGGFYLFTLIDSSSCSKFSLLIIVGLEAVIISWVYGADRFFDNIEDMIGYKPFPVLKYCWMFVIPLVCWLTLSFEMHRSLDLPAFNDYIPSFWYNVLYGAVIASVLISIPLCMLMTLYEDAKNMTRSSKDLRQIRPYSPQLSLCKRIISMGLKRPIRSVEEGNEKLMMEENWNV